MCDLTNQEIIDRIIKKGKTVSMDASIYDVSDFGPQRFDKDGNRLYETSVSGCWHDGNGNQYYCDDIDTPFSGDQEVFSYNPTTKVEGKKRRDDLDSNAESWLACHESEIPEVLTKSVTQELGSKHHISYDESVNEYDEDGEKLKISNVEFSKDLTELSLQELKDRRRACWDPAFAIDRLMLDWDGEEYLLNLLLLKQEVHSHIGRSSTKYGRFLWVMGMQQKVREMSSGHWSTTWAAKPIETGRFTSLDIEISDSYKYKGKKYVVVKCLIDGKHWVTVRHVEGYSWISSHKNMTPATLNELLAFAGV
jgi:hypothetical protein